MRFEPGERHSLSSADGARILMLLSPWPGEGHFPASASCVFAWRRCQVRYVRRSIQYVSGMNATA